LTLKLAQAKALKDAGGMKGAIVVAGDAVVSKGEAIFGMPRDIDVAIRFLQELSGSTFQFTTSVAVLESETLRMLSAVEPLTLRFGSSSSVKTETT
jgi:predicted house-cleaning NTP pyrophosphatase (Maf/HAM1 superfamily)